MEFWLSLFSIISFHHEKEFSSVENGKTPGQN